MDLPQMDSWLTFSLIFWGFACFCFGFWLNKMYYENAFKKFSKEMHRQYLIIMEKQGVKIKESGQKILKRF